MALGRRRMRAQRSAGMAWSAATENTGAAWACSTSTIAHSSTAKSSANARRGPCYGVSEEHVAARVEKDAAEPFVEMVVHGDDREVGVERGDRVLDRAHKRHT